MFYIRHSLFIIHAALFSHLFFFLFVLAELYKLTGEILGEGAYASVQTCINIYTDAECAVKIIDKIPGHARARVFREVETFHHCQGHPNILQLIEFFEDKEKFYLVFEKINGGPLLARIQENICFSEHDAAQIMKEIASGLNFLHKKGIAHRDLKPENILCVNTDTICPIKICDFDLGSGINFTTDVSESVATPQLLTPVSCITPASPLIKSRALMIDEEMWNTKKLFQLQFCESSTFFFARAINVFASRRSETFLECDELTLKDAAWVLTYLAQQTNRLRNLSRAHFLWSIAISKHGVVRSCQHRAFPFFRHHTELSNTIISFWLVVCRVGFIAMAFLKRKKKHRAISISARTLGKSLFTLTAIWSGRAVLLM